MKKWVWILSLGLLSFNCADDKPTINGINQEEFDQSVAEMERSLPSDQMPKLKEAIQIIYQYDTHQDSDTLRWSRTRQILNMKNSDQIFTIAEASAHRNGIKWDRNSLGPLDMTKVNKPENKKDKKAKPYDEVLKNAKDITVTSKEIDQNNDGINDAIMIFVEFNDEKGNPISYNDADVDGVFTVYNNNQNVFQKNYKITNSQMGQKSMLRGVILPYAAFDAENTKGNQVSISVKAVTPYQYFTKETPKINISFDNFIKNQRIDQQRLAQDKLKVQEVVESFILHIGGGELKQAHQLSVNPDWNNYETFSSDDLGFGGVKSCTVKNVEVKDFDPVKEKAKVSASYLFIMNDGEELNLKKLYQLQKIAGNWKIVGTQKLN